MKKILILCFLLSQIITHAQDINNRLKTCGSDAVLKENPEMASKIAAFEIALKNRNLTAKTTTPTSYRVPVVVHVMHKGEPIGIGTNITDDDIKAKIKFVNEQFRKIPLSAGDGAGVDMEIEFVLAVRDPNGNPTNGIVRYNMTSNAPYRNYGVNSTSNTNPQGISQTDMKALSVWDSNLYYNIWIVSEIDNNNGGIGIQGEAVPPVVSDGTTLTILHGTAEDGLYLLSNTVKDPIDRTLTHELGHAFFLYHTFQGDNNGNDCPLNNSPFTQGDGCADTAPHRRTTSGDCSDTVNSCDPNNPNPDLSYLHNYMNYTLDGCRNMFTANQKTRALYAMTQIRSSLLSSSSTNLVPVAEPIAGFLPSQPVVVIAGSSLQLSDASTGVPNNYLNYYTAPEMTFNWNITSSGTEPLTSADQNPIFNFTTEGIYNVSHDIDNGLGTDNKTANQVIYVTAPAAALPITPTSTNTGNYSVNYVNLNTIEKTIIPTTNTSYADYTNTDNTLLISGKTYELNINTRAGSPYVEHFAAYIDWNGDGIFNETNEKFTSNPINNPIPANSSIARGFPTLTVPANCAKNKLLRMRISVNAQNPITNDMINGITPFFIGDTKDFGIYVPDPQSLRTEQYTLNNLNYYPNPVKDVLTITNTDNIEKVEIYNITGQLLLSENFQDTDIKVNLSQLVRGAYIAKVYANGGKSSIKILKN
ncbi:MAG: zinc-dependent metalloprotease [Flavobacterium sp.]